MSSEITALDQPQKTVVQVVENATNAVIRELDATGCDPDAVAEGALRNLNCFQYSTRTVVR